MKPPHAVGGYRIGSVLGRGGMGIVYRARHETRGDDVALKMVSDVEPAFLESMRREIHTLARLDHPGIVRIVGEGLHDGLPWYAMRLVEGRTLAEHVGARGEGGASSWWTTVLLDRPRSGGSGREGRLPGTVGGGSLQAILDVARRLCAPLAYLHGEGVVHRDLKPANVLVTADGAPVIIDFGLVTDFGGGNPRETLRLDAEAVGTVAYVAPEQGMGEHVDARADLYALGCILFELVTGRPPFAGATALEVLQARYRGDPPRASDLVPDLPPELDTLLGRLLARDPRRRLGYADDVAAMLGAMGAEVGPDPAPSRGKPYVYRPSFAGREEEMAALRPILEEAISGRGRLVLVGGASGVGKTRLAVAAAECAHGMRFRVLLGECPAPGEGREGRALMPFAGPLAAIGDQCREIGEAEIARVFGPRLSVLAVYEPSLASLAGAELAEPAALSWHATRERLHGYLAATLREVARDAPVLLVLDDLQWADELSLSFLDFLIRRRQLEASGLVVLGLYRAEELPGAVRELRHREETVGLDLPRLPTAAVASIASDMLAMEAPRAELVAFLERQSEGNPFFLAEYVRSAVAEGLLVRRDGRFDVAWEAAAYDALPAPESLLAILGRRLQGLSAAAVEVLSMVATFGRETTEGLLLAAGIGDVLRHEGVAELVARHVLELPAPGRLRIGHDRMREAAYDRIAAEERPLRHRRAAAALESLPEIERRDVQAALGHHHARAGEPARARPCFLAAARRARSRHDIAESERLYREHLALVEHEDADGIAARNELGEVLVRSGRAVQAIAQSEQALAASRALGLPAGEAASLRGLGIALKNAGRMDEAKRAYDELLRLARRSGLRRDEGIACGNLATWHHLKGLRRAAGRLYGQALRIARETSDRRSEGVVLNNLAAHHYTGGRLAKAYASSREAVAIARELEARADEGARLGTMASIAHTMGRAAEASELYRRALAIAREVGDRLGESFVLGSLASISRGRGAEVEELLGQALAIARSLDDGRQVAFLEANLAIHLRDEGRPADAARVARSALALARDLQDARTQGAALFTLGHALVDVGELGEAREVYGQLLALGEALADASVQGDALLSLARLQRLSGGGGVAALIRRGERAYGSGRSAREEGALACERGHLALAGRRSAAAMLRAARGRLRSCRGGDLAILGPSVDALARAQARFDDGGPLLHGEVPGAPRATPRENDVP